MHDATTFASLLERALRTAGVTDRIKVDDPMVGPIEIYRSSGFEAECIFDNVGDAELSVLLHAYLDAPLIVAWDIGLEFAKILAKRGHLVAERIESLITVAEREEHFSNTFLLLAYLGCAPDGERRVLRLLDIVPEDSRDGLFLACLQLKSRAVDEKLMSKFQEWHAEYEFWSSGSGEIAALERFIGDWLQRYSYASLEGVVRVYFQAANN